MLAMGMQNYKPYETSSVRVYVLAGLKTRIKGGVYFCMCNVSCSLNAPTNTWRLSARPQTPKTDLQEKRHGERPVSMTLDVVQR